MNFTFNNPIGSNVPMATPSSVNVNLLGDITIVNHRQIVPDQQASMLGFATMNAIGTAMIGMRQQMLALEKEKLEIEKGKLALAAANINDKLLDNNKQTIALEQDNIICNNKSNGIPKALANKLEAEEVEYSIVGEETVDGGKKFHLNKANNNNFVKSSDMFSDAGFEIVVNEDSETNIDLNSSIFKTLSLVKNDNIIEDLTKQEIDGKTPSLISSKDGKSVIVGFILDKDGNWRNKAKKAIIENSKMHFANFFKEDQEYLFFIYDNSNSIKANCAVFVTPVTINQFLNLDDRYYKEYDNGEILNACKTYTDDVYRILEPIVPSSSKINKLFRPDDYKYYSVEINPLYSRDINSVKISANLASSSVIKICN